MTQPPLASLIPHRPPMRLIDEIVDEAPRAVVCRAEIRRGAPFVSEGRVSALVALELFAQSAAALIGLAFMRRGIGAPTGPSLAGGALVGCHRLDLYVEHLSVGDVLDVHCRVAMSLGSMAQVDCRLVWADSVARGSEALAAGVIQLAGSRGAVRAAR